MRLDLCILAFMALPLPAYANTYVVAPSGGDFNSIQDALDVAVAGDVILVRERAGGWAERPVFVRSGNASAGFIELRNFPGERPTLELASLAGQWGITIEDKSYVRVEGFELQNNHAAGDGSGVRVQGAGSHIELVDNWLHDFSGPDSMAITVYGTSSAASISELLIEGNQVWDCTPARSEAITLNGNVEQFVVAGNLVRDVDNIGIDFIGGESDINPVFVARDGVCRGNWVLRANSSYGGGFAGGIYVDGGRDILIEQNVVVGCDLGIEIGAENTGLVTSGVVVRNNLVLGNEKVGIVFGGYDASVGRVEGCRFAGNVCFKNDTLQTGLGELWIQYADDNIVAGNVFYADVQNILLYSDSPNANAYDFNLWFTESGAAQAQWDWQGTSYLGLASYQAATGHDPHSRYGDPLFLDPYGSDSQLGTQDDDFRLNSASRAIDLGDAVALGYDAGADFAGQARFVDDPGVLDAGNGLAPLPDAGAHEYQPADCTVERACVAAPNSDGDGAYLGFSGTTGVGANDLVFTAVGGVSSQPGLLFYGPDSIQVPFGAGFRCVGGGIYRVLPPVAFDGGGGLTRPLDLNAPPANSGPGEIRAGSRWNFQFWYRDPGGMGSSGFNLTDALVVRFCP